MAKIEREELFDVLRQRQTAAIPLMVLRATQTWMRLAAREPMSEFLLRGNQTSIPDDHGGFAVPTYFRHLVSHPGDAPAILTRTV